MGSRTSCSLFVDPICPFAWIAYRWMSDLERNGHVKMTLGLVSLSVINQERDLDQWYRDFNDSGWGPARVAAAAYRAHGEQGLRRFYASFGMRRHVEKRQDDGSLRDAIRHAGLDPALETAASNPALDDDLRAWTTRAVEPVQADVGTPIVHLGGIGFFGPVLTSAPRGQDAIRLWDALAGLAATPSFVEYKRGRTETLQFD
jgi:hypothetical protein